MTGFLGYAPTPGYTSTHTLKLHFNKNQLYVVYTTTTIKHRRITHAETGSFLLHCIEVYDKLMRTHENKETIKVLFESGDVK